MRLGRSRLGHETSEYPSSLTSLHFFIHSFTLSTLAQLWSEKRREEKRRFCQFLSFFCSLAPFSSFLPFLQPSSLLSLCLSLSFFLWLWLRRGGLLRWPNAIVNWPLPALPPLLSVPSSSFVLCATPHFTSLHFTLLYLSALFWGPVQVDEGEAVHYRRQLRRRDGITSSSSSSSCCVGSKYNTGVVCS
jgi:hypothetical protein